jgi:two-component system response regulator AtoC
VSEYKHRVLIVDDEANIHYSFKKILPSKYQLLSAQTAEDGIKKLKKEAPDIVVMDIKLPGMDGLEALKAMRKIDARIPVIMMTAFGTVNTAITAMKFGAYEYLLKPFDINKMRSVIQKALESSDLMRRQVYVAADATVLESESGDAIVGTSDSMQEVYKMIGQVAEQDVTVLIWGESGTGKELVARAIYHHSKRSERAFLEVNCAALPENLLESELFGYEKGAFTGAVERHIGKFEQVHKGTLFLDEIGEMSLTTQAKILRVIQYGEFTRVGGKEVIRSDVRLLVATNRNLEAAIRKGVFREDLYYRLNVISIYLPPLRERSADINDLVNYFIAKYNRDSGKNIKGINAQALDLLKNYSWPGNVRQLENCIRRAIVLTKDLTIMPEDLELEDKIDQETITTEDDDYSALDRILNNISTGKSKIKLWPTVEKMLITKALQKTQGNQVQAAQLLGIHRNTLRNRMEKYDLTNYNFS